MSEQTHVDTAEQGLVPLFTLSPQAPTRSRQTGDQTDEARAVFQRHHTFGYDCRLDDDFRPGGDYDYEAPGFKPRNERNRRLVGFAVVMAFLTAAGTLVATQPVTRDAVGGMASRFFGGSPGGAPAVSAPSTPTSGVLDLTTGQQTPGADATPTADPSPTPVPTSDATPVPTAAPPSAVPAAPTPATAAPIHVSGTFATAANGKTTTTCQAGKTSAATCTWQVTVAQGYPFYATVTWPGAATLQMSISNAAKAPLYTDAGASGSLSTHIDTPPATVYVSVTVQAGTSVTYDLGLAAHPF